MDYVIDRFEGDIAVLESDSGEIFNIPRAILPECAQEGQVISVCVDEKKTDERKTHIQELMKKVWAD